MNRGTIRTITAGGETMQASFLGQGTFCKAWRVVGTDRVIVFSGDDLAKDVLANCENMPHLPTVQRIDNADDPEFIFEMPYYEPLTAANKAAWADFRALSKCYDTELAALKTSLRTSAYRLNSAIVDNAPVSDALRAALCELADSCRNWGDEYAFEFAKRNLAVYSDGRLILLDVVYSAQRMWEIRDAAHKKRRGY